MKFDENGTRVGLNGIYQLGKYTVHSMQSENYLEPVQIHARIFIFMQHIYSNRASYE